MATPSLKTPTSAGGIIHYQYLLSTALNYLLNLYNEKFVDVNSKDYIIEQFTKEK